MLATLDRIITPGRAKVATVVVAAIYLAATVIWLATSKGLIDRFHQPIGGDFIIFYAASKLTLAGHAAAAFDPAALVRVERGVIPGAPLGLYWCYPPTFQIMTAPLGVLPFPLAYAAFIAVTIAPYALAIRTLAPGPWAAPMALASPGAFANGWQGQNGFLTAALLGFGLINLERRPWVAGCLLGLLAYKPQFGLLLPVLLIGAGHWKALTAAALTSLCLVGLSVLLLGAAPWAAFFHTLPGITDALASERLPWSKMASIFIAARWLGASPAAAIGLQIVVALAVAGATLIAWRRPGAHGPKVGLAVLATFLMSPYSFNYDLVVLAIPIAAAAQWGRARALPVGTKSALLLAALTPVLFLGIADATHVQLMPLAIALCYLALWRIVWRGAAAVDERSVLPGIRPAAKARAAGPADCAGAPGALV